MADGAARRRRRLPDQPSRGRHRASRSTPAPTPACSTGSYGYDVQPGHDRGVEPDQLDPASPRPTGSAGSTAARTSARPAAATRTGSRPSRCRASATRPRGCSRATARRAGDRSRRSAQGRTIVSRMPPRAGRRAAPARGRRRRRRHLRVERRATRSRRAARMRVRRRRPPERARARARQRRDAAGRRPLTPGGAVEFDAPRRERLGPGIAAARPRPRPRSSARAASPTARRPAPARTTSWSAGLTLADLSGPLVLATRACTSPTAAARAGACGAKHGRTRSRQLRSGQSGRTEERPRIARCSTCARSSGTTKPSKVRRGGLQPCRRPHRARDGASARTSSSRPPRRRTARSRRPRHELAPRSATQPSQLAQRLLQPRLRRGQRPVELLRGCGRWPTPSSTRRRTASRR